MKLRRTSFATILLVLSFASAARASNGAWTVNAANLPHESEMHAQAAYHGFYYVIGGASGTTLFRESYYAPLSGSAVGAFATTTSLPAKLGYAGAAAANGRVYVAGGIGPSLNWSTTKTNVFSAPAQLDGPLGAWRSETPLPSALANPRAAVWNGYIYVVGGQDSAPAALATVYYAKINNDGTLGVWNSGTALPEAKRGHGLAVYNGKIYVIGGKQADAACLSAVYYNTLNSDGSPSGSWTAATSIPVALADMAAVVSSGYIYTIGGQACGGCGTSVSDVYYSKIQGDGSLGAWSAGTAFPEARQMEQAFSWGGAAINPGGKPGCGADVKQIHATTLTEGTDSAAPAFSGIADVINCGSGCLELRWNNAADVSSVEYEIFSASSAGGEDFAGPAYYAQHSPLQITGLANDTPYHFVIRARDSFNNTDTNTKEIAAVPFAPLAMAKSTTANPVIPNAGKPFVYYDGGVYHMWYAKFGPDIFYARSLDGQTWTDYPGNPVIDHSSQGWHSLGVWPAQVIRDGAVYKMWEAGLGTGYAWSPDGISWTESAANPFTITVIMAAMKESGTYKFWGNSYYESTNETTLPNSYATNVSNYRAVIKDGSLYKTFYADSGTSQSVFMGVSSDAKYFTKYETAPMFATGAPASFDANQTLPTAAVKVGANYNVWYEGGSMNGIGYANTAGVFPPTLVNVAITPAPSTRVLVDFDVQFTAMCTYSGVNPACGAATCDCTAVADWNSTDPAIAVAHDFGFDRYREGLVSGAASGTSNISATVGGVTSNPVALTVLSKFQSMSTTAEADDTRAVAWADYDGDGDLDFLAGNYGQANRVYRNDGGAFTLVWSSPESDNTTSVAWGDYDGDGRLDMLAGNYGQPLRVYRNIGGDAFSLAWSSAQADNTTSVAWADLDRDGGLDIIAGNNGQNSRAYRNDSGAGFTLAWTSPGTDNTQAVAAADYDKDGDPDLLFGNNGQQNRIFRNDENWNFTEAWSSPESDSTTSAAWGDYDGDGAPDLLIGNSNQPNRVYRNAGGGVFPLAWSSAETGDTRAVAWGDYNNDGKLDILAADKSQPKRVYTNNGAASFTLYFTSAETEDTSAAAWGDYDGDYDVDLLIGNNSANRIYRNNYDPVETAPSAPAPAHIAGGEITGSIGNIRFAWPAGSDAETPAAMLTYDLRVGSTSHGCEVFCGAFPNAGVSPEGYGFGNVGATTSYSISLPVGTYYWSVRTADSVSRRSAWSAEDSFSLSSGAPVYAGLEKITGCGSGCLELWWSEGVDPQGSTPVTYNIYQAASPGVQNFSLRATATTATHTQITGLANDTAYYFAVRAMDTASNEDANSIEFAGVPFAPVAMAKSPANPVVASAASPTVFFDGSVYHMWYSKNSPGEIFYARSLDGQTWTEYAGGPVIGSGSQAWHAGGVAPAKVLSQGGVYKLWETGAGGTGFASSTNGVNWIASAANPFTADILNSIIYDGGVYKSWGANYYEAANETPANVAGDTNLGGARAIIKDGSAFKAFYSDPAVGSGAYMAESPDGKYFTKQENSTVMNVGSSGDFDAPEVRPAAVLKSGAGYQMWYDGGPRQGIGYANTTGTFPPALIGVSISPSPAMIVTGGTLQFTAVCAYAAVNPACGATSCDCTKAAEWSSGNPAVAAVDDFGLGANEGLAHGIAAGSSPITATVGAMTSAAVTLIVDETPSAGGVVYDGTGGDADFTNSTTGLSANWSGWNDPETGVAAFYYAIGTSAGATNVVDWTTTGLATNVTVTDLSLVDGTKYFFSVKAVNAVGLIEIVSSDGITVSTNYPSSAVTNPGNNSYKDSLPAISGAATDASGFGLAKVDVSVRRNSDGLYWNGAVWASGETWLTASGTASWSLIGNLPQWSDGDAYTVRSRATGNSTNVESPAAGNLFGYDSLAPAVAITSPAGGATLSGGVSVSGAVFDYFMTGWSLNYGPGAAPSAWREIASGTTAFATGTITSWDASTLSGTYTLKLSALDAAGKVSVATAQVTVGNAASPAGTVAAGKWKLMAAPVEPSNPSTLSIFGATAEYKIYRWDNTVPDDQYQGKYRYPPALHAGYGFWIRPAADLNYNYGGSITNTTQDYVIPLKSGWNMIGSPFNRAFPWAQARIRSGGNEYDISTAANLGLVSATIYGYDEAANSWTQTGADANLETERGYMVRAFSDVDLVLGPGAGRPGGMARQVRQVFDYRIKISAVAEGAADLDNYLGAAGRAAEDYDFNDAQEPPSTPDPARVSLYFPHDGWSVNAGRYSSDFRKAAVKAGDVETWDFSVETVNAGNRVALNWDAAGLPAARFSFMLLNVDTGESVDMAQTGSYVFSADGTGAAAGHFKVQATNKSAGQATLTHTLKTGWNLISVPVEPVDTSAAVQFGDDLPVANIFQVFDGKFYNAAEADVQAGASYWVFSAAGGDVDVSGTPLDPQSPIDVPLNTGWNLVGNPFGAPILWGDNISVKVDGRQMPLSQAAAQGALSADIYRYDGGSYAALGAGGVLEPWTGYAIKVKKPCNLIMRK